MFRVLHVKSNTLNIKLDEEGEGRRMGGPVDRSKAARAPHSRRGRMVAEAFVNLIAVHGGGVGGGIGITATHRC